MTRLRKVKNTKNCKKNSKTKYLKKLLGIIFGIQICYIDDIDRKIFFVALFYKQPIQVTKFNTIQN